MMSLDWAAIGGFGGCCAGVGAIAALFFNRSASSKAQLKMDNAALHAQVEEQTKLKLFMEDIPVMKNTLTQHLIECANMNGAVRTTLQNVESSLRELSRAIELLRGNQ